MFKKIELDAPNVGVLDKNFLSKAVNSGFISSVGPFVAAFEKRVARFLGVKGAVAVQSGTAAIHMSLYELGICPGDEVIVPALTFAASLNPILYVGATPVIIDVDSKTWNIDVEKIKQVITKKTKAIIPVHLYGNPCNMPDIMAIAEKYNLYVIEDATESLGAKFNGRHTGTYGDMGCYSFNGNKLITTGGGGIIVSSHLNKIGHIRYLVNQAKDKDIPGFHREMGFNYRMTNIEAALGLAQFEKMEQFLSKKRNFKGIYQKIFSDLPRISFQEEYRKAIGSCWLTCIKVRKKIHVDNLMQRLKKQNIPTRRVFRPLGQMPYLKKYTVNCPNAVEIYNSGLCLPGSTLNTEKDIQRTALVIKEVLSNALLR